MEAITVMEKLQSDEDLTALSNEFHTIARKTHNKYPLVGGAVSFLMLKLLCCCGYYTRKPLSAVKSLTTAIYKLIKFLISAIIKLVRKVVSVKQNVKPKNDEIELVDSVSTSSLGINNNTSYCNDSTQWFN